MTAIRAVLVDDEEPARDRLRALLAAIGGVDVVAEAADGDDALQTIAATRPDLVFLDVDMPGRSGIEVAARLGPPRPRIVFCTAWDHYAIEAFEQHATDYLLKPVGRERLVHSIERVRQSLGTDAALREEVEAARRTQARLYPRELPPLPGLDYAGASRAARDVAGDWYDFLPLGPQVLGLAVGDVAGKGLYAGLLMASVQARLQSLAPLHGDAVERVVAETSRHMHRTVDDNRYATLVYARWDDARRELAWVNAGHPPPLVLRPAPDGRFEVERLAPTGTVVGLLPEGTWRAERLALEPGALVCAYSDGVTEAARGDGEEFGEARLAAALARAAAAPAAAACARILDEVDSFAEGAPAADDRTIVVGRVR